MRAIFFPRPRSVELREIPPPEPKDGEVLVRCTHVALCGTNMGPYLGDGRWGRIPWPPPPGWLGHENIGQIIKSCAPGWPEGTNVLAHPDDYNGFVEYIVSKPAGLARLPEGVEDLGAMVVAQPLATVLRAMARTGPVIRQRCAIVGQGPMGLIFTQVLGRMGASQIIAIDSVAWRLRWSQRYGATAVIDSTRENVVERVRELTDGQMVDFSVEAVGKPDALLTAAQVVRRRGRLMLFGVPHDDFAPFPWWHIMASELEMVASMGPECMEYFQTAVDMIVRGDVDLASMVTPRLPWHRAAEAFEMYANPADHEDCLKITLVL